MNILYIGGFELPDKNAAAHRVLAISKSLKEEGHRLFFLGIRREMGEQKEWKRYEFSTLGHEYIQKYPEGLKKWLSYLTQLKNISKIITDNKIDAVIAYNFPSISFYRLLKFCRKIGIKVFADCTEWYVPQGSLIFRMIKGFDSFFRMKYVQPRTDGLIVISKYLKEYYLKKMNNIVQIPPTVDLDESKWEQGAHNLDERITLVYGGSPDGKQKDHLGKIIESLKEIQHPFYLKIFGITKSQYDEVWFDSPVDDLITKEKIEFFGRVTNTSIIQNLKNAHFSIFIRDENLVTKAGFPTKFVESISSGTPVLTNKSSNIADFLVEGKNGMWLDTSSKKLFKKSFQRIFDLDIVQIHKMKQYCEDSKTFHFKNYTEALNTLFR